MDVVGHMIHDANGSGIIKHLSLIRYITQTDHIGVQAWIAEFMAHSGEWIEKLSQWPNEEANWVSRFIESGDDEKLWRFVTTHSSVPQVLKMTRELLALEQKGTLKEAFELLGMLK